MPEEEEVWGIGLHLKNKKKSTCYSWILYLKAHKRLRKNACELKETNEVYARKRKNGSYFLGKGVKSVCRIKHRQKQQVKIRQDKDILHEKKNNEYTGEETLSSIT